MNLFADLIYSLNTSDSSASRVDALTGYLNSESDLKALDDALILLLYKKPKRLISTKQLKEWAPDITGQPAWLIQRCEKEVGSFIGAFSLLLRSDQRETNQASLAEWLDNLKNLQGKSEHDIKGFLVNRVSKINSVQRSLILKLMLGRFTSPVSGVEITNALGQILDVAHEVITLRLKSFELVQGKSLRQHLKISIESEHEKIPERFPSVKEISKAEIIKECNDEWSAFGKRNGIGAQLVKYGASIFLWTEDGNLITDKFPEITNCLKSSKFDYKIFGQIIPRRSNGDITSLYKRIENKNEGKTKPDRTDIEFEIWEILNGKPADVLSLASVQNPFVVPKKMSFTFPSELLELHGISRSLGFSGIVLKHKDIYRYWPAKPFQIQAILTNAEFNTGANSSIQSLTFGVLKDQEIVPIAKISRFSKNIDLKSIFEFVKLNTVERFGPIRTVPTISVWEIHFDAILNSPRRKSKIALVNAQLIRELKIPQDQSSSLASISSLTDYPKAN